MKNAIVCFIGLVFVVSVSAEPLLEGRVRLESGEPVADAQVRLFDLTDLRQRAVARAQTDDTGYFALPLAALRGSALPEGFALGPNYPNPFNPSTIIPYQLAASSEVRLEVFNLLGQRIATLVDGVRPAGFHTATWHATDAAGRAVGAGVYIYRMTVGVERQTGRMVLLDGQAGVSAAGAASGWPAASSGGDPHGEEASVYRLIVEGRGLTPLIDSAFRVEAGMAPVELVVSSGRHPTPEEDGAAEEPVPVTPAGKILASADAPGKPTNLRVEALTDSSAQVRWDAVEGATDYDVNYKTAVGGTWTNEPHKGTGLYNTIYDLEPGTEYRWAVRAENSDGPSDWVFGTNFTTRSEGPEEDVEEDGSSEEPEPDAPVTIPDAKLRAAIAAALGKARGATITVAEMKTLTTLEAEDAGIRDLTGLEFATNLTWLSLSDNQITDLSALAGLTKLEVLGLGGNTIRDISALAGLTNLWWLGLDPGEIDSEGNFKSISALSDISALSSLTNLRILYLGNNQIRDISALAGLINLTHLYLWNNRITDVSALAGLTRLTELNLNDNPLNVSSINDHIPALQDRGVMVEFDPTPVTITDDPTPVTIPDAKLRAAIAAALGKARGATITVAEMSTLRRLNAANAVISDLTGLEFATNLTHLHLWDNRITDISALSGLTKLTSLDLWDNRITDISALSGLTNLTNLTLWTNQITDISALSGLINLTYLGLSENRITDISMLSDLTNLTSLGLWTNQITDISALSGLINLTYLGLSENRITDISVLSDLTNLTSLGLDGNNLTDISALSGLTKLEYLQLGFNNISDISAFSGLTNLTELGLKGIPLSVSSINDHIPALQARGVTVRFDPPFRESDFDIEFVFLDDHFTEKQKRIVRYAARRWMSIIRKDLPDYKFTQDWSGNCGDQPYEIPSGERIDDLRIYVGSVERMGDVRIHVANEEVVYEPNASAGPLLLREAFLPVLGCVTVNLKSFDSLTSSYLLYMWLHEMGHILGIGTAIMYESDFLQDSSDDPHFNGPRAIAAFDDAGGRDYTSAKVPVEKSGGHWRTPVLGDELMSSSGISTLSAITIQALADLGYSVDVTQADPYTLPRAGISRGGDDMEEEMQPVVDVAQADPYAAKASAKIAASSTHAQPKWTCGVGAQREPIYVVDQQGRIVRTLGD